MGKVKALGNNITRFSVDALLLHKYIYIYIRKLSVVPKLCQGDIRPGNTGVTEANDR